MRADDRNIYAELVNLEGMAADGSDGIDDRDDASVFGERGNGGQGVENAACGFRVHDSEKIKTWPFVQRSLDLVK
ncbi:hypothetical protein D3C87_1632920 [compost metagenome]